MQKTLKTLGIAALALTLVPPVLFAAGAMAEATMKWTLLAAAFLWFATAPFFLQGGSD